MTVQRSTAVWDMLQLDPRYEDRKMNWCDFEPKIKKENYRYENEYVFTHIFQNKCEELGLKISTIPEEEVELRVTLRLYGTGHLQERRLQADNIKISFVRRRVHYAVRRDGENEHDQFAVGNEALKEARSKSFAEFHVKGEYPTAEPGYSTPFTRYFGPWNEVKWNSVWNRPGFYNSFSEENINTWSALLFRLFTRRTVNFHNRL